MPPARSRSVKSYWTTPLSMGSSSATSARRAQWQLGAARGCAAVWKTTPPRARVLKSADPADWEPMSRRPTAFWMAVALSALAYAGPTPAVARTHNPRASCAAARGRCRLALPRLRMPALSDRAAARLVHRSSWEPRPDNAAPNQHAPSAADLAYFRAHSEMPYKGRVTGAFSGTTDEIIQWAAYKHVLDPDLLRAVAAVESWWHMSTNGDNGDSFGLFQIRRPYHCCDFLAANDSAFNADYYGAIIRSYYDDRES